MLKVNNETVFIRPLTSLKIVFQKQSENVFPFNFLFEELKRKLEIFSGLFRRFLLQLQPPVIIETK